MSKASENGILFRTSMNGFNKADVNKYIQDENIRFTALEAEYNDKIKELERELELSKDEVERLSKSHEEYMILQKEAADTKEALAAANSQIRDNLNEITSLNNTIAELTAKASDSDEVNQKVLDLLSENASLRKKIAELEAIVADKDSEIDKLAMIAEDSKNNANGMTDDEKNEFTDMLLRAKYASEDMLKRAEEGAGIIIDRAKDEMFTRRYEAVKAAKEIFNAATEELRRSIGVCMNDFVAAIRNAKNDSSRTSEAADICDDDLRRRIERMQNDLDRAIAEKLAEFDSKN